MESLPDLDHLPDLEPLPSLAAMQPLPTSCSMTCRAPMAYKTSYSRLMMAAFVAPLPDLDPLSDRPPLPDMDPMPDMDMEPLSIMDPLPVLEPQLSLAAMQPLPTSGSITCRTPMAYKTSYPRLMMAAFLTPHREVYSVMPTCSRGREHGTPFRTIMP